MPPWRGGEGVSSLLLLLGWLPPRTTQAEAGAT